MGEYVWTRIIIGGKAPRAVWEELEGLLNDHFSETDFDNDFREADGKDTIGASGERNFGNADEEEAFCLKHNLTFHLSWAAQPGVFGAGCHYWNPRMPEIADAECDDDATPSVTLDWLNTARLAGQTLEGIIEALSEASPSRVPNVEIVEEISA